VNIYCFLHFGEHADMLTTCGHLEVITVDGLLICIYFADLVVIQRSAPLVDILGLSHGLNSCGTCI
jgi:hypothetical protein